MSNGQSPFARESMVVGGPACSQLDSFEPQSASLEL
jgi:hypothetical protein